MKPLLKEIQHNKLLWLLAPLLSHATESVAATTRGMRSVACSMPRWGI